MKSQHLQGLDRVGGTLIFVGQNVGQTVGYGIGIARVFVRQLFKTNVI